jgi:heme exporter protein CcmD
LSDFLAMSGYAAYVWPSLGLGVGLLLLNIHWARRLLVQAKAEARRRIASGGEA